MPIFDASDLETLGPVDWVIDVAANPTVLKGVDGKSSSGWARCRHLHFAQWRFW
jgi:hypothetical protein